MYSGFLSRYPAVQTSLEALLEDSDRDVAFFAKQTLEGRENGRKGEGMGSWSELWNANQSGCKVCGV